jgi:formyl-CoA transferase
MRTPEVLAQIERPDLLDDPRFAKLEDRRVNAVELMTILEEVFASRSLADWRAALDARAITYDTLALTEEVADDPQMAANGVLVGLDDGSGARTVSSPIALSGAPKRRAGGAPELGEHTDEVLASLGYDEEARARMRQQGVVTAPAVPA